MVGRVSEGGMDAVLVVQGVTKAKDEGGNIQFKLKFDQDSLIGLKNSMKFKDLMPWVCCAFGKYFLQVNILAELTFARAQHNITGLTFSIYIVEQIIIRIEIHPARSSSPYLILHGQKFPKN